MQRKKINKRNITKMRSHSKGNECKFNFDPWSLYISRCEKALKNNERNDFYSSLNELSQQISSLLAFVAKDINNSVMSVFDSEVMRLLTTFIPRILDITYKSLDKNVLIIDDIPPEDLFTQKFTSVYLIYDNLISIILMMCKTIKLSVSLCHLSNSVERSLDRDLRKLLLQSYFHFLYSVNAIRLNKYNKKFTFRDSDFPGESVDFPYRKHIFNAMNEVLKEISDVECKKEYEAYIFLVRTHTSLADGYFNLAIEFYKRLELLLCKDYLNKLTNIRLPSLKERLVEITYLITKKIAEKTYSEIPSDDMQLITWLEKCLNLLPDLDHRVGKLKNALLLEKRRILEIHHFQLMKECSDYSPIFLINKINGKNQICIQFKDEEKFPDRNIILFYRILKKSKIQFIVNNDASIAVTLSNHHGVVKLSNCLKKAYFMFKSRDEVENVFDYPLYKVERKEELNKQDIRSMPVVSLLESKEILEVNTKCKSTMQSIVKRKRNAKEKEVEKDDQIVANKVIPDKPGILKIEYAESRFCFFHLSIDPKIKKKVTSETFKIVESLVNQPNKSRGSHQGVILTRDDNLTGILKLKLGGHGARFVAYPENKRKEEDGTHMDAKFTIAKAKHG